MDASPRIFYQIFKSEIPLCLLQYVEPRMRIYNLHAVLTGMSRWVCSLWFYHVFIILYVIALKIKVKVKVK